ncbi:hypothetical protein PHJA_002210400 [Phtheirospermum japonicum]|uniref:Uncharacterized protein n=1 Tax=Phtheirospermum japonicum TaxID=374723 RepID=A0A830CW55_9LAMI|nr:hypothetical protein PHJA_002151400 [Phtheirospermum japonicum]GFQ00665.1 hypothetical protein PHJA_002210400 [Phtheirospermum japonicum]
MYLASKPGVFAAAVTGLLSNLSRNASDTTNDYIYASGDVLEPVEKVWPNAAGSLSRRLQEMC